MICVLRMHMLLLIAAALLCMAAAEREIGLPTFIHPGTVEKLLNAKKTNFYREFEDEATLAVQFMENEENIKKLIAMEKHQPDPSCVRALTRTLLDYSLGRSYALEMNDATGKRESGLYKGNFLWFGRYFECKGATGPTVSPYLCNVALSGTENASVGLTIGMCVPDVCKEEELQEILQVILSNNGTAFVSVRCPETSELDAVDITAIVIYSVLTALVIGGTICEVVINKGSSGSALVTNGESSETKLPVSTRVFLSFSIIKNTKNLFNTDRKEGNLDVLDGMRFISMAWIVLGHTFSTALYLTDNIVDIMQFFVNTGSFQAIANGTFSVDTFFFLSGLLVAYLGLREMDKRNGKLNIPLMYLSRYLRLTPCMAAVVLYAVSLSENIGEGPLAFTTKLNLKETCQKYWWTNFLYINNLYPKYLGEGCISWVWYLGNDMQFYLLSPLFLFLFYRSYKAAIVVVSAVILISTGITGALSTVYNVSASVVELGYVFNYFLSIDIFTGEVDTTVEPYGSETSYSYWSDIYAKPWCRIGVYLIGMATGYFIHVTRRNVKMSKEFAIAMWIIVIAMGLAIVYCFWGGINHFYLPSQEVMSFYNAVSRPLWGLCLAWVTIACVSGYGGPINTFLSWKAFLPLSRLTYCVYLIHPIILWYMFVAREIELHFQVKIIIYYYLAVLMISYAFAYLLSMAVEAPTAGIIKIIFPKKRNHRKPDENGVVIANEVNKDRYPEDPEGIESVSEGKPPEHDIIEDDKM